MISLLCPTRGRPWGMRRFVQSVLDTHGLKVEVVWYIDDDDTESHETARELSEIIRTSVVGGPRTTLSEAWNQCAKAAGGRVMGHMGDDIVFRTEAWDCLINDAFEKHPDRIALVHGRDGIHDARLGTHGFLHRRWVEAVGYFVPPYFSHDYNDLWLTEVADMIGRRVYLEEVFTEHLHHSVGKSPWDDTYKEHEQRGARDNVTNLYASLAQERRADAAKLRAVMA